jgi:hypothetical protein
MLTSAVPSPVAALFERAVTDPPRVSTALRELYRGAEAVFRAATLEGFLESPDGHRHGSLGWRLDIRIINDKTRAKDIREARKHWVDFQEATRRGKAQ